jgi:cellulose biosynthesis protein BcsQ
MSPPVLAVANVKGGVAKTTTAVQLALHAGGAGNRTLLIDADPGRSALSWATRAGEDWPHAMVPVIAHHHPDLPRRLPGLAEGYDLVVIDTPHDPTGGARVGATVSSALAVADLVVIPSPPSAADLDRLEDLLAAVALEEARRDLRWFIALTRVDMRRRVLAAEVIEAITSRATEWSRPVLPLDLAVPERAAVEDAFGTPTVLVEYEPLAATVLGAMAETTAVRA